MKSGSDSVEKEAELVSSLIEHYTQRVARAKQSIEERKGIDGEEETVYPILPSTSRMMYFSDAMGPTDVPEYLPRVAKWENWCLRGMVETSTPVSTRAPFCMIQFRAMCRSYSCLDRDLKAQVEFTELVLEDVTKDVIGYFVQSELPQRILNTLCCHQMNCVLMLTRKPNPQFPWQHSYEDLSDKSSRLHTYAAGFAAQVVPHPVTGAPIQFELSCVYMLDFTPMDVFKVRSMYPRARIVGICTPGPGADEAILKTLHIQLGQLKRKLGKK